LGSLEAKKALVAEYTEKIGQATGVAFADFKGLTVKEVTELRKLLRAEGVELVVAKNTLINIAANNNEIEGLSENLKGTNMWAFSMNEAFAGAKVLNDFAKTHKALVIKGGIMDKKYVDAKTVVALANIPSREVLLGMIAGLFQSPIAGAARAIKAIADKKAEEAPVA